MNLVVLSGHLTKDVSMQTGKSGKEYAYFTLGVKTSQKIDDEYKSVFISCKAFSGWAKAVDGLKKGKLLTIKGELDVRVKGEGKEKTYYTEVVCQEVLFEKDKAGKQYDGFNEVSGDDQDIPW
jgi:single-stranded DNA-binding protein